MTSSTAAVTASSHGLRAKRGPIATLRHSSSNIFTGTQYRSAVFYHNDEQRELAEKYKERLDESGAFDAPIVTEITKFQKFYPAEDYHQEYFALNGRQPYCRAVVKPKVVKFRKAFKDKLKVNDKSGDEEE